MSTSYFNGFSTLKAPLLNLQTLWGTFQLGFLLTLLLSSDLGLAASFDCAKAGTAIEKAICSDKRLGRLDEVLAQNYRAMSAANIGSGALNSLRSTQRSWLAVRNQCADAVCIGKQYEERIDAVCSDYPVLSGVFPSCTSAACCRRPKIDSLKSRVPIQN